jgi:hypothetical protein
LIFFGAGLIIVVGMIMQAFVQKTPYTIPLKTLSRYIKFLIVLFLCYVFVVSGLGSRSGSKSRAAALQSDLSTIQTQFSITPPSRVDTQSCAELSSKDLIVQKALATGEYASGHKASCIARAEAWAISVRFPKRARDGLLCTAPTDTNEWCVDSSGVAKEISGPITSAQCN